MAKFFSEQAQHVVKTASDVATNFLRESILNGTLAPGTRLNEEELASQLGLSRTPVRKALVVLEHEGLVQSERNRGAIVREYDADSVDELYSARAWLEGLCAYRAASKVTPDVIDQLEESCARFDALRAEDDVKELIRENFVFHGIIMEAAASPRLSELVRMATTLPLIYKSYHWFSDEQKLVSGHFHKQITVALASRNGERAEHLMRAHLLEARDFLVSELQRTTPPLTEADSE